MRKLLSVLFLLLFVIAAFVAWLMLPSLRTPRREALAQSRELLAATTYVPDDVSRLLVVHSVAATFRMLSRHEITADAVGSVAGDDLRIASLLSGDADALLWREDGGVRGVVLTSPLRRALIRFAASWSGDADVTVSGERILIGTVSDRGRSLAPELLPLAPDRAAAVLLVERKGSGGALLPIDRPYIASVDLADREMKIHARGAATAPSGVEAPSTFESLPGSMLTAIVSGDSAFLRDLDRLLPLNLAPLATKGLLLSIRSIDTGALLPRPRGVIAVADNAETRSALGSIFGASTLPPGASPNSRRVGDFEIDRLERLGATVEVARLGGRLILGLDPASLDHYLTQPREMLALKAGESWLMDVDPAALRPVARAVADKAALRILAPKVARRAKQAEEWLSLFPGAGRVTAVKRSAGYDELDITISTPSK